MLLLLLLFVTKYKFGHCKDVVGTANIAFFWKYCCHCNYQGLVCRLWRHFDPKTLTTLSLLSSLLCPIWFERALACRGFCSRKIFSFCRASVLNLVGVSLHGQYRVNAARIICRYSLIKFSCFPHQPHHHCHHAGTTKHQLFMLP